MEDCDMQAFLQTILEEFKRDSRRHDASIPGERGERDTSEVRSGWIVGQRNLTVRHTK